MAPPSRNPNMTKRATGTVPKTASLTSTTTTKQPSSVKASGSSRKNTEIVAPTPRELNDLNTYLLSVAESTKQQNGEGHSQLASNCFELDALNFQENQRSCWPVRPIPRRKAYKEIRDIRQAISTPTSCSNNISHHPLYNSNSLVGGGTNLNPAAIGVVIPTTPNSSTIEEPFTLNRNCQYRSSSAEVEPEIHNQTSDVDFNWDLVQYFLSSTLKNFNKASVDRAQSVTSIHTVASEANTPTYEELQTKLEASARNMQSIKDQQEQLLRLQQAAKQHLNDMEVIRSQHTKDAHFNQNGNAPPDYESVEQVREDMDSLVSRMKSLTTFIQNQNELSNLLGEDGPDILAEQLALQKKLEDLKAKKQDMQNLISELQEINTSSERFVQNQQNQADSEQILHVVPDEFQRVVPIELVGASKPNINLKKENSSLYNGLENCLPNENHVNVTDGTDDVDSDGVITDEDMKILGDSDVIRQKCADINTMKQQLKRLKDMMDTVKLIEEKAEGKSAREIADEAEHTINHPEQRNSLQRDNIESLIKADNESCNEMEQNSQKVKYDQTTQDSEDRELAERVRVLQEMKLFVQDQVSHLAAERDRIKSIKDEIQKRRDTREDSVGKLSQRAQSPKRIQNVANPSKEIEKDLLKIEYETKKKEFEKICQRLEEDEEANKDRVNRIDRARESVERHAEQVKTGTENMMYFSDNWDRNPVVSSSSSMQGGKAVPLTPIRGKESADSGAADVHGVTSIEARSFQSGCSSGFSGRAFNTRGTDNPQFGFNNFNSPRVPPAPPQWNSNCYYQLPFAQQFSPHCHHPPALGPNAGNADFFCSQQCHNNGGVPAVSTAANPQQTANVANSVGVSADPVLLQQFIQTQQMLINSVYQCNQLLWHQQREINNLNKTVLLLQERLKISNLPDSNNLDENRIEGQLPNGIFCGNRAQSEPRHPAPLHTHQYQSMQPPLSPIRQFHAYNYNNSYHHQRRNLNNLQQSLHAQAVNSSYNFSHAEEGNMCSQMGVQGQQSATFNNATLSQAPPTYLNNDSPQTGSLQNGAPPIFMHHHNNTITPNTSNNATNNSNLVNLHQNCLNSPSTNIQSTSATGAQIVPNSNNAAAAAAALNNQVPPGNRANNYWDNFRSYSRQNLLSTNSCKSNEDQSFGANTTGHNSRSNQFNPNRNLQHLNVVNFSNAATNLSNLPPSAYDTKYFHTFRNEIGNNSTCPPTHPAVGMIGTVGNNDQSNMLHALGTNNDVGHNINAQVCPEQLQNYNIMDNQLTLTNANDMFNTNYNSNNHMPTTNNYNNVSSVAAGVQDTRNMNFNYEINELKKKIPYKTTCNTKRVKHSSSAHPEGSYTNQNVISQPETNISINTHLENATAPQSTSQRRSIDENLENPTASADNSTISNELKRNLLENALKNDKFTMKFFESLKEDVYQEVYSIIKATESQPHHLVQLFKELQLVPSADPIRNIVLQAMHDLYKRSCANSSDPNDSQESARRSCSENSPLNASGSTSTSCNSRENVGRNSQETKQSVENNSCEIVNSLINSDELKRVAYKIMFESSSGKAVEKGNKKNSCDAETVKLKNELFRPDFEMVHHIMNNIRNAIATQVVDDTNIIRIAKLTCSSVENLSSPTNSSQNERVLLSPKMLYRVMKSFENRDREAFFAQYETYLNSLFVIKSAEEDINLINKKCRECPQGGFTLNSNSGNTNDEMQHLRKITPPSKSNISMNNSLDLGMEPFMIRKGSREEVVGSNSILTSNMTIPASYMNFSEQNNNSNSSQPPDLITTADVAMLFGGAGAGSYSTDQQESSPCNNNNVMNEDLAEADQICSNNTLNAFTSNRERINNETEQANLANINIVENNNQQSIDECQANNADEMSFSDSKAEEDSFETIDNNALNMSSSAGRQTQDSSDEIMMVVPTANENLCNDPDDVSCVLIMPMEGSAAYNNGGNEASGSNNYIIPPKQRSIP